MVHEWIMSLQHWRNNTDGEKLHGVSNEFLEYYLDNI
jgi:hypothetical protein